MDANTSKRTQLILWIVVAAAVVVGLVLASKYTSFLPSALHRSVQGEVQALTLTGQLKPAILTPGSHTLRFHSKTASGQDFTTTTQFSISDQPSPEPSLAPSPSLTPSVIPSPSAAPSSPNLVSDSLTVSTSHAVIGQAITFTGSLKNTGTGAAANSKSMICVAYFDDPCINLSSGGHQNPGLDGGSHLGIFTDTWTSPKTGTYTVKLCADVDNNVTESNEADNCVTQEFGVNAS